MKRIEIFARDGFRCDYCGRGVEDNVKLEIDHRTPQMLGGGDNAENLVTACSECNREKSSSIFLAQGTMCQEGNGACDRPASYLVGHLEFLGVYPACDVHAQRWARGFRAKAIMTAVA